MLDETVWFVHFFLEDDHHLTITDMWQEMAAHFSYEAGEAKIVHALQQLHETLANG